MEYPHSNSKMGPVFPQPSRGQGIQQLHIYLSTANERRKIRPSTLLQVVDLSFDFRIVAEADVVDAFVLQDACFVELYVH